MIEVASMKCSICNLKINERSPTKRTGDQQAHEVCFDIAKASLAAELEAFMLANPNDYELLPNGNFRVLSH